MKVTAYRTVEDSNANRNGVVIEGMDSDEILEKANEQIARHIDSFYAWSVSSNGKIVDGCKLSPSIGCWD